MTPPQSPPPIKNDFHAVTQGAGALFAGGLLTVAAGAALQNPLGGFMAYMGAAFLPLSCAALTGVSARNVFDKQRGGISRAFSLAAAGAGAATLGWAGYNLATIDYYSDVKSGLAVLGVYILTNVYTAGVLLMNSTAQAINGFEQRWRNPPPPAP